jgi:hypothetical protein
LNQDLLTWKKYPTTIEVSESGLQQLKIDLSDVVLSGTGDSSHFMNMTIPRFQVRLDSEQIEYDAFQACINDEFEQQIRKKYCLHTHNNELTI